MLTVLKLGKEIIDGDPHLMSSNGKLLFDIIERQNLIVVNATNKCHRVITRQRILKSGVVEESCIDYFIVCVEFYNLILSMTIDRSRVMTKFSTKKGNKEVKESDHFLLVLEGDVNWKPIENKSNRIEIYNYKDIEGLKKFKELKENFMFIIYLIR